MGPGTEVRRREHYFFIDVLRAVACFLVVFHHCLTYFEDSSLGSAYLTYFKPFFPTVTLYLLVSGFVHCTVIEAKSQRYSRYVGDKFRRIMIPYFCVSALTLVIRLIAERLQVVPLDEVHYTPFQLGPALTRYFLSGVESHYYFLELLFLYLLVFPFLIQKIKRPLTALVFFLAVLAIDPLLALIYSKYRTVIWTPTSIIAAALSGFKFFLFGFVLNRLYPALKPILARQGTLIGIFCLLGFAILHAFLPKGDEYWFLIELLGYFSIALALFNRRLSLISQISSLSFGIYLLHQPYFVKLARVLLVRISQYPNAQLLLAWVLTTGLTIATVKLLETNRITSRLLLGKSAA